MHRALQTIILEEASLEFVPSNFWKHESCRLVEKRFAIPPDRQILDDNYHHAILSRMTRSEKRGRPDIVHSTLLDIVSTPAYKENLVEVYIHTLNDVTINLKSVVRLPRSFERFCGMISKVISGELDVKEEELFDVKHNQKIDDLIASIESARVICLTTEGIHEDILSFVKGVVHDKEKATWVIGGFSRGHFEDNVKSLSTDVVSISKHALAANVVAARLCVAVALSLIPESS